MHLICDNYATHKHERACAPGSTNTPDSNCTSPRPPRRGSTWSSAGSGNSPTRRCAAAFHSVPDLIAKIEDFLAAHNNDPKPFVWTATAQDILAKVARGRVALQAVNQ